MGNPSASRLVVCPDHPLEAKWVGSVFLGVGGADSIERQVGMNGSGPRLSGPAVGGHPLT